MKKITLVLKNPRLVIYYLGSIGLLNWMPDKLYLRVMFKLKTGQSLNLNNPITFNEKLQWLKLNDRRSYYPKMVDKYTVRQYVEEKIGKKYLIPLLGVYDNVNELNFKDLPESFVLKCTHDSGGIVICKDKKNLDIEQAKNKLNKYLKRNYYYWGREWPYKTIRPRIVCEQFMINLPGEDLMDYKFHCFSGEPRLIQVDYDRFTNHKRNLYDSNWKYIEASIKYPSDRNHIIERPEKLEEMLKLASILSEGHEYLRVDFYYIKGQIYFGELTFYHGSGNETFYPEQFGELLGEWINLRKIKMERIR